MISDAPLPTAPLLISARECATALGISERTLWNLSQPRGSIPTVREPGRRFVRYSVAAVADWIADRQSRTTDMHS